MSAWSDLAEALAAKALEDEENPVDVQVYSTPPSNVQAPALVIRPDHPWKEQANYVGTLDHYLVIAVATASDVASAYATLDGLVTLVVSCLEGLEAWDWSEIGAPLLDDSTGSPFLASAIPLTFRTT